jgi:hypothetical protein
MTLEYVQRHSWTEGEDANVNMQRVGNALGVLI